MKRMSVVWFLSGCSITALFLMCGFPYVMSVWQKYVQPAAAHTVSSRTPIKVQTLEGFAFILSGGFGGKVSGVVVKRDGPMKTLCIAVCVQDKGPAVEHQFIVSDLEFGKRELNGDLVFVRTP